MADEHDAWFKDTFGLDLGQATQGLPDGVRDSTVIYWKEGETLPTVESKGRVEVADLGEAWQMGEEALEKARRQLARDADAIPGVVEDLGRPREIAEQAAAAVSDAASDAVDSVQQGVADVQAEAAAAVDSVSETVADTIEQGLVDMGNYIGGEDAATAAGGTVSGVGASGGVTVTRGPAGSGASAGADAAAAAAAAGAV